MLTANILGKTEKYKGITKKSSVSLWCLSWQALFCALKKKEETNPWSDYTDISLACFFFFNLSKYWKHFILPKYFSRIWQPWLHRLGWRPAEFLFGPEIVSPCTGWCTCGFLEWWGWFTKAFLAFSRHCLRAHSSLPMPWWYCAPLPLSSHGICQAWDDVKQGSPTSGI